MLNKIKKNQVSKKTLIISTVIFIVSMIIMNIVSARLNGEVLDFRIGYTADEAYYFLQDLGENGRRLYTILLLFDFVFPFIYMIFGLCLANYVINRQKYFKNWAVVFVLFPIFAMICDWVENILILLMLQNYNKVFLSWASMTSSITLLKFVLLGIFLIWIGYLLLKNSLDNKRE